jgi:asparagine synthase (glutamine-hydrolysing)
MSNAEGIVWITYNGEIYNTDEIRPELERLRFAFCSRSDTEVILHGYEAWGAEVVQRLRGMFAFAILDLRGGKPSLFLARDRLGIKPLYYAQVGGMFLFASELKALQASGLLSREISPAGLVGYLMFGSVPNPWTIYEGIWALPPASTLTWQDGHVEIQSYWRLPADTVEPRSYREAVEQVRSHLEDAVRSHLVSDVPLGAFLSGGLDSSTVVALMRRATSGPIRTCSIVFEEKEYSEAPYAWAMAEAVGAEHYERVITAHDVLNELDNILRAMDQPTVDGVNTYFVSKTAREAGLTVALSGLGGDELFGGYPNTFQGVPQMVKALRLAQRVPAASFLAQKAIGWFGLDERWRKVADALDRPASPASAYIVRRGLFSPSEVRALVTPEVWHAALQAFDPVAYVRERTDGHLDLFRWVSQAELRTYTHNQLMRDTDVMSMAHSLELRVPLLDHRLVQAVLRLPEWVQRNGQGPKALLVDVLGPDLPYIIRERRDKMGFSFPFDVWIREALHPLLTESLPTNPAQLSGYLRRQSVHHVGQALQSGRMHWARGWGLAVLGMWIAHGHGRDRC